MRNYLFFALFFLFAVSCDQQQDIPQAHLLTDKWWYCESNTYGNCFGYRFICNLDGTFQSANSQGNEYGQWWWIETGEKFAFTLGDVGNEYNGGMWIIHLLDEHDLHVGNDTMVIQTLTD